MYNVLDLMRLIKDGCTVHVIDDSTGNTLYFGKVEVIPSDLWVKTIRGKIDISYAVGVTYIRTI